MSGETPGKDVPKEHIHDGIVEYDNDPPVWLTATFFLTMAWGLAYLLTMHLSVGTKLGPERLQADLAELAELRASKDTGPLDEAAMRALSKAPDRIARGETLYATSECATCHGPDGTSDANRAGPNLRDRWWIHGSSMENIANVIREGANNNAMPAQGRKLSNQDIANLAIYLVSLNRQGERSGKPADPAHEREAPITY
ncbi:MAG TPA: c-type cytochrome [Planctomycetota bacterium]|jgi:cytochrome c oxidase cbb3-type subunit 3|nr:c-type cytochrome [Planctomycetota bacterium]